MGEAKEDEAKAEAKPEENKEEKKEENKEEKPAEEKKEEEAKPSPPKPIVLSVDLHCVGCARKIERSILKCKGVESVVVDMAQNQVTVTGLVDPEALCSRIQMKTLRRAKILSPLPPPEGDTKPAVPVPALQASGVNTVELLVNMHCEACAQQLKRKIVKMRGVQTAETNLSLGKVIVTGTMTREKIAEYIHRRTGKLATIVPPPPPPPPPAEEEKKEEPEKKAEEKPAGENKEEKKEASAEKKEEEKKPEEQEEKTEGNNEEKGEEEKKETVDGSAVNYNISFYNPSDFEMMKRMLYWNGGDGGMMHEDDMMARRMVPPWMPPVYVVASPPPPPPVPPQLLYRTPPPQIFSDENPNACCIS